MLFLIKLNYLCKIFNKKMEETENLISLFDKNNMSAIKTIKNNAELNRFYVDKTRIPKPFYGNIANVKAIVIGPDPSLDKSLSNKYVFGLENPGSKYFRSHEFNLRTIGLGLDNIYVQNLVQNYCTRVTDKNPNWFEFAEIWKPTLKQELDTLFSPNIPVFFTSARVLSALVNDKVYKIKLPEYYLEGKFIKPSENYLNRTMIPMLGSHYYNKWELFSKKAKEIIHKL